MAGYIGSFSDSLRTLIGWQKPASQASEPVVEQVASCSSPAMNETPLLSPAAALSKPAKAEEMTMSSSTAPKTFLQHLGSFFKNLLHIGVEAATIAEPFVAVAFPEVTPIYSTAIGLATAAEATAASATGTGAQKLASVTSTLVPEVQAWAKANGIVWDEAGITKWTSALVDTLNLIPAPAAAVPAGAAQTAVVAPEAVAG